MDQGNKMLAGHRWFVMRTYRQNPAKVVSLSLQWQCNLLRMDCSQTRVQHTFDSGSGVRTIFSSGECAVLLRLLNAAPSNLNRGPSQTPREAGN
jgi:hypothetical protein